MNLKNLSNKELAEAILDIAELVWSEGDEDILLEAAERLKAIDNIVDDGR